MRSFLLTIVVGLLAFGALAQKPDSSAKPVTKTPGDAATKLPSAKEVIDNYVKAIGGRDALTKHKSRYQKGSIELSPMGVKGTVESYSRSDDRSLTKLTLEGIGELLDGYDGKSAWTVNPIQGNRVKEGAEFLQAKRNSIFGREVNIDKLYNSLKVRGIEKVGDRDAYVIVASSEGLPDDILYFDTENALLLRSDSIVVTPEGNQAMSSFYDDYREVDGIKSAFKVRGKTPAFEISTVVSEVKYGIAIEDSRFVQPQ